MPPRGPGGLRWQDDAYVHNFDSGCSLGAACDVVDERDLPCRMLRPFPSGEVAVMACQSEQAPSSSAMSGFTSRL